MSGLELSEEAAEAFAADALALKFPLGNAPFEPRAILQPRREINDQSNLWTVFNNVQENLMKGGVTGQSQSGRRHTSRPVTDINVKLGFNQRLWALVDDYLVRLAA